jgi:putative endonuclease
LSGGGYFSGLAAEDIVLAAYCMEGARLLARRWRCSGGELDLVLDQGGTVIFVEVKARRRRDRAAEAVTDRQWRRIRAAAEVYLSRHTDGFRPCRIDLVVVDGSGETERIENIIEPGGW